MEYDYFIQLIANYLPMDKYFNEDFEDWMRNSGHVNLDHYADYIAMTMPAPRIDWYTYSNIDDIAWRVRRYINGFLETAGPLVL